MARRRMSWLSIASGFALLSPLPVQAQSLEESLPTGARVRVTLASETDPAGTGPGLIGRLAETRPGSILLATSGSETRELRRDAIVTMFTLGALVTEGDCVRSPDAAACVGAASPSWRASEGC